MTTDFSYGGKQTVTNGPIKPGGKDMPGDARTRVDCYADIARIPNPYVGLKITVKVDETNNNKMTDYIVKSLKANSMGFADTVIDEVVRYVDYLGVNRQSVDTNNFATKEELGLKADKTELHSHTNKTVLDGITSANVNNWNNKVDKVEGKTLTTNDYTNEEKQTVASLKATVGDTSSGLVKDVKDLKTNGVSQDNINAAIENYLTEHPVAGGATTEQAAQIEANRVAIGDENSGLIKEVNNIKNTELQNLNTAILRVNETVGNKSELPVGDANIIASINRIDGKTTTGNGLTTEQAQQLQTAYEHSQSTHVQPSDIPSLNGYATETFVTSKIEEAQLSGGEVDLSAYATKTYADNAISTALDGHTFKFLTQAEYDVLPENEKNSETIEYHITDATDNSHTHANKEVLDKISEDTDGSLLFNGNKITSGSTSGGITTVEYENLSTELQSLFVVIK